MAGIGIELRELVKTASLSGFLRANMYAAILSSSAWLISVCTLVFIYFYLVAVLGETLFSIQFLVGVTYLTSFSLILSGLFQQSMVRYIADCIFEKKYSKVSSTVASTSLILILMSFLVGLCAVQVAIPYESWSLKLVMLSAFVSLNIIWLFSNALAGLKKYRFIVVSFFMSYFLIFISALKLYPMKLFGLMLAYYLGQAFMLACFYAYLFKVYPARRLFSWDFFSNLSGKKLLMANGSLFQMGVWVDKYVFWFSAKTGIPVLGYLSASSIYDMPMFIAFLIMLPGLAMYFYEVEANYSHYYHGYYDTILDGATLKSIQDKHRESVFGARMCLVNTMKIQCFSAAVAILFAPEILHALGLAPIYVFLLRIDLVSASLMVFLIGLINLLYYLNETKAVFYLCVLLFGSNTLLSIISLKMLPMFYGYGFLMSMILTNFLALIFLIKAFHKQTFRAFMDN